MSEMMQVITCVCRDGENPSEVRVKGSFDEWKEEHVMDLVTSEPSAVYEYPIKVDSIKQFPSDTKEALEPIKVQYKFIVDGEWVLNDADADKLTLTDDAGNVNHVLYIQRPVQCAPAVSEESQQVEIPLVVPVEKQETTKLQPEDEGLGASSESVTPPAAVVEVEPTPAVQQLKVPKTDDNNNLSSSSLGESQASSSTTSTSTPDEEEQQQPRKRRESFKKKAISSAGGCIIL
ncbi:hypothetical protein MP228_010047 [Amoeboaphelidium protococcarum]|nr:hypothetical protein MP228_010047 [Amoeboaphelidium protococcarum]